MSSSVLLLTYFKIIICVQDLLSMEPWTAAKKAFSQCGGATSSCPGSQPKALAPSVASVTSVVNNKGDNEMILGAVHRSPGICLTVKENPRKLQLGGHLIKGCETNHRLKWGPFPPNKVGRIAQHVRKGERRMHFLCCIYIHFLLHFQDLHLSPVH